MSAPVLVAAIKALADGRPIANFDGIVMSATSFAEPTGWRAIVADRA